VTRASSGSRGYGDIVRTNIFTLFTGIPGVLLAVVVVLGRYRDGLVAGVLLAIVAIASCGTCAPNGCSSSLRCR
jgi:hypothetical protein